VPEPLVFLSPIHKATRQIGIHLSGRMADLGLAGSEGHLLSYLGSYAPVPISELARVFGLKKSTLTSMLDRLEERGLLRRELHPEDRRSFLVHLTRQGRGLAGKVRRCVDDLETEVRAGIRSEDLNGFRRVMESIAEVTQVEVKPTNGGRKA
jgi:DNA-binding MarR family transcriptional regulator